MFETNLFEIGGLDVKVLDLAISDHNSIFYFAYLFIYLLFFFERISTKKKVYFDLSSSHLETASWVG